MQEEVTQKTIALSIQTAKLTASVLQKALKKLLEAQKKKKPRFHQGKQTLRQLMKHNTGVSNIEITDENIKAFEHTAKKYGVDFALKKDISTQPPRYLVFFKGRDADVLTAAFKEFSAKNLDREKKPSIRKLLSQMRQKAKQHRPREKVKTKERGQEL
ncbi:PcfB family protein [Oscillospiraceae bacterium MB08-C2-2]|nr:PcfB family protein [Oscillospiraceae bacterium MB08-C2-2]